MAARGLDVFIENLGCHSRVLCGGSSAVQLRFRSDKHAELMGQDPSLCLFSNPVADHRDLRTFTLQRVNHRWWPVEYGNRVVPVLAIAIHVGYDRGEEAVRLGADLVGGAVVDPQGARATSDVHADGFPRERLLEDTLTQIASEEKGV